MRIHARSRIGVILTAMLLIAFVLISPLQAKRNPRQDITNMDWPLQGGSLLRSNNFDGSVPSYPLKRLWETPLGGDVDAAAFVHGGNVYLSMEVSKKNGALLLKIDAAKGDIIWAFERRVSKLTLYPVATGNTAFFGCKNLGMNRSLLYAVDLKKGEKLWDFVSHEDFAPPERTTAPCVWENKIYVPTVSSLLCISAAEGKLLWTVPIMYPGAPVADNGIIYTGNEAFKAQTGEKLWEYRNSDTESENYLMGPALYQGKLIAGSSKGDMIVALDAATGKKLWQYRAEHTWKMMPCISNGLALINADMNNKLIALDLATGDLYWESGGKFRGNPAVAGDFAYLPTEDSFILVISVRTGEILFRVNPAADRKGKDDTKLDGATETIFDATPVITGRHLFAPSRDRLFCLEQKGKQPRKTFVSKSSSSKEPYEIRHGVINGTVIDKTTYQPVTGAALDIYLPFALKEDGTITPLTIKAITDSEGNFSTKTFVVEYSKSSGSKKKAKKTFSQKIVKQQISLSLKGYKVSSIERQLKEGYNNLGKIVVEKES